MSGLLASIKADLASAGLEVRDGPGESTFSIDAAGHAGGWTIYVWAREEEAQVIAHGVVPWAVPDEARSRMATYLTLANYGLLVGNFEMNLDDGELRYKTSLDFEGLDELPLQLVRNLVAANVRTMERYLPGLAAVAEGADPKAAVTAVESTRD